MDVIMMLGRLLFALVFIGSGIGHLSQTESTARAAAARNVPSPRLVAQGSGLVWLAGGLGVVLGIWTDLAFLGLAIAVLITAFVMHPFWGEEGERQQIEMAHFMKNLSIAGAAIALFAVTAYGYDGWQLVGPALDLGS